MSLYLKASLSAAGAAACYVTGKLSFGYAFKQLSVATCAFGAAVTGVGFTLGETLLRGSKSPSTHHRDILYRDTAQKVALVAGLFALTQTCLARKHLPQWTHLTVGQGLTLGLFTSLLPGLTSLFAPAISALLSTFQQFEQIEQQQILQQLVDGCLQQQASKPMLSAAQRMIQVATQQERQELRQLQVHQPQYLTIIRGKLEGVEQLQATALQELILTEEQQNQVQTIEMQVAVTLQQIETDQSEQMERICAESDQQSLQFIALHLQHIIDSRKVQLEIYTEIVDSAQQALENLKRWGQKETGQEMLTLLLIFEARKKLQTKCIGAYTQTKVFVEDLQALLNHLKEMLAGAGTVNEYIRPMLCEINFFENTGACANISPPLKTLQTATRSNAEMAAAITAAGRSDSTFSPDQQVLAAAGALQQNAAFMEKMQALKEAVDRANPQLKKQANQGLLLCRQKRKDVTSALRELIKKNPNLKDRLTEKAKKIFNENSALLHCPMLWNAFLILDQLGYLDAGGERE